MSILGAWLAYPTEALIWSNSGSWVSLTLAALLLLSLIGLAAVYEPQTPITTRTTRRLKATRRRLPSAA